MINQENPVLHDDEFALFQNLIYEKCAISLKESKKPLVSNRLSRRLKACGCKTYKDYYKYVTSPLGGKEEFTHMVDSLTTNKTEFFRSPEHFEWLVKKIIPEYLADSRRTTLRIWSAGCSSGEEPYSIAITCRDHLPEAVHSQVKILATDISSKMLDIAKAGIYKMETVEEVNPTILKAHFLKGPGKVKVKDHLPKMIEFRYLNLNEPFPSVREKFDIIFCRNVIIYFDRETQEKLMNKFYDVLKEGGYLFLGNSESLHGLNTQFRFVAASMYQK